MSFQNINNVKTLIIGCGIAGLYYAYRDTLAESKIATRSRITINNKNMILDAYDWIGGRIKITTMRDKSFSTGAGVIRPVDDQLIKLCEELNLELIKLTDAENYYTVFGVNTDEYKLFRENVINIIKDLFKKYPEHKNLSVKEFLSIHLNHEYVDKIFKYAEYDDAENMMISDLVNYYPLEDYLPHPVRNMYSIKSGWKALLDALVKHISGSYEIQLESIMREIIKLDSGFDVIYVRNNQQYKIRCEKLVIACNLMIKDTVTFSGFKFNLDIFLNQFGCVKFAKLFTYHEHIPDDIKGATKLNHSILSKMIFMDSNLIVSGYLQNDNAEQLDNLLNLKKDKLNINIIIDKLINNTEFVKLPPVIDYRFQYWPYGVHYWKERNVSVYDVYKKTGLIFVGEMVANNQGWTEGAIESVNNWFTYLLYITSKYDSNNLNKQI